MSFPKPGLVANTQLLTSDGLEFQQTFDCGSVAQILLCGGSHGVFVTVNLAFWVAATLGSSSVDRWSSKPGRDLCLMGREPWRKSPVYFLFQTLGAFLGAGIIFGVYSDALWDYGQGTPSVDRTNATAGIFAT
ncbi:unnamed protein product [Gadus morhua 'NCC']